MKKYELTNEKIEYFGIKLYRIKALRDFEDVKTGDLGGYIKKEKNLSQEGNAWVYNNAKVFDNARIFDNARVSGDACAWVSGNAKIFDNVRIFGKAWIFGNAKISGDIKISGNVVVSGNARISGDVEISGNVKIFGNAEITESNHILTTGNIGSRNDTTTFYRTKDNDIHVVCGCFSGNIEKFKIAVVNKHAGNEHEKAYKEAIEVAKLQIFLSK